MFHCDILVSHLSGECQEGIGDFSGLLLRLPEADDRPVGSVRMLNQPMSGTGVTSRRIVAPRDLAFFVAAWMSSTRTYGIHADGAPGIIWS